MVLAGLAERLQSQDSVQGDGETRLERRLRDELALLPQIAEFSIADQSGQIVIDSENDQLGISITDRKYFWYHTEKDSRELFIDAPILGRAPQRWIIPVSRRYNNADGGFAGVATVFLELNFFQKFYEQFDIGHDGAILLMSGDAKLLARRPFVEANIGRDMSQSNIAKALQYASFDTIEIKSTTDGVVRLNSYRRSDEYPLVVAVARSMDDILAPWWDRAMREVVKTSVLLILLVSGGLFVWKLASSLAKAKRHLDTAINAMDQGLCLFDAERRIIMSNDRFRELYGYPPELLQPGTPLATILGHLVERGARQGDMTVQQYVEGISESGRETVLNIDGKLISIIRTPILSGGWVATHEDISERTHAERVLAGQAAELRRVNEYFETAINSMPQGVCLFDAEERVIVANSRYAELYHLTAEQIKPGITLQHILDYRRERGTNLATAPDVYRSVNVKKAHEVQDLADGRTVSISRRILSEGGWLTTHEDITDRRKGEKQIAYLAAHDSLTGLLNRASFVDAFDKITAGGEAIDNAAIFLLDLDRFKAVNDTFGHAAGDQLLKQVASRLSSEIREQDIVARLGGDEFAIIQKLKTPNQEAAISLALRIIGVITKPFELDGHTASVGTSIGIVLCPEQGIDRSELMKKADLALYAVKAAGRNDFRIYDAELMKVDETEKLLRAELSQAIDREEFELYYQPIIDAKTEKLVGAEALIRWRHPHRGMLSPDQFIPLAEETGLIAPLGEWVLQKGCQDASAWPENLKISINLSAHQFNRGNLFDVVLCTLVESGLSPARLELEITESALLDNQSEHLQTLRQLRSIGVSIVLDDFGTGYSSARYLTLYPFDKIKIDKSFVQGMVHQRESSAIVASTLTLARGLGISVTAEGVETQEQLSQLCLAGADFIQGYLIGRPMTLSDFLAETRQTPARIVA